jgi:transcriptional regulator of acetoin/glycerol metabolism
VPVDLRVICASHRTLHDEVEAGRLRADLHGRLAGHTVALPPLRARREDLGLLIGAIVRRHHGAIDLRFERDAARALFGHDWPLNVRELEQALNAAVALAPDGRIGLEHLPIGLRAPARPRQAGDAELRAELVRRFTAHRGNLSAVAREMGKERVQIRRWCRRLGLDPDSFRDPLP